MKKKTSKKKTPARKSREEKLPDGLVFRERRFRDINLLPKHPKPIPGYKATLPGPPGWQVKQDPGA